MEKLEKEQPLHPTPMTVPMMKGKMYVDASRKPTVQGIWGMTHSAVNKGGHTNDFKVVRMEAVGPHEENPLYAGEYKGYFKLSTTGYNLETVNDTITLHFRPHTNGGWNVYGHGVNRYGHTEILGTLTQLGKIEIFKMEVGTTTQPEFIPTNRPKASKLLGAVPPKKSTGPVSSGGGQNGPSGPGKVKSGGGSKKKSSTSKTKTALTPPNAVGLPGGHVRALKDVLVILKKGDKKGVFLQPVPSDFRGLKGFYSDVIRSPMDLGTVSKNIDAKYRTAMECIEDIRLVFANAKLFNLDTEPVHALAASLSGKFEAFISSHREVLGLGNEDQKPAATPATVVAAAPGAGAGSSVASSPPPGNAVSQPKRMGALSPSGVSTASVGSSVSGGSTVSVKTEGSNSNSNSNSNSSTGGGGSGGGGGGGGGSKSSKASSLTWEEQDALAKDVAEVFRLGSANPDNERAQARVYALWSFAKAYVAEKDQVEVDGAKGAEIRVRMDALNAKRQRQLWDVVKFFLEDSKNDSPPQQPRPSKPKGKSSSPGKHRPGDERQRDSGRSGNPADGGISVEGPRKRTRSDLSDSQDEEDGAMERVEDNMDEEAPSPLKRSRDSLDGSERMKDDEEEDEDGDGAIRAPDMDDEDDDEEEGVARSNEVNVKRMDSSRLIIESTTHQESEIDIDLEDDEDEEDNENPIGMGGGDGGAGSGQSDVDEQWTQAQEEKRQREERDRIRQAQARALEEQRQKEKAKREKERIEEGLRICRERAAEKARQEAAAAEKARRERAEIEKQREAERLARDKQVDVDLDQCRTDSNLMSVMDSSVYDD